MNGICPECGLPVHAHSPLCKLGRQQFSPEIQWRKVGAQILIGLTTLVACATDVHLAWDRSQSPLPAGTNQLTYVVYAHTNSITSTNRMGAAMRLSVGTNLTTKVSVPAGTWYFAVTTADGLLESDLSNILTVEIPKAPDRLRTVILQYSVDLTNYVDAGYFRVKIQ